MSTIKQKKLAKLVVDNLAGKLQMTGQQMLEKAGYGRGVAESPARAIKSAGVQDELKALGFDIDTARRVIGNILIHGREDNQILAAREVFKVMDAYPRQKVDVTHTFDVVEIENYGTKKTTETDKA